MLKALWSFRANVAASGFRLKAEADRRRDPQSV